MASSIRNLQVQVTVPVPAGAPESDVGVGTELRRLWLVEQVRLGRIGVGKAAELAFMPRAEFMQLLGEHGVPVIDYSVDELERELSELGIE